MSAQGPCFLKLTADVSSLTSLERFGDKDFVFINWRLCRHCLQNEWPLVNLIISKTIYIYLSWKTNEFQSLILTPAWQNIGEWTVWIFVERSLMPRLFGSHNTKQGHSKGHYSVDENQKLRIFELSYLPGRVHVLACHNFLLENTWNGKINILEKLKI